MNTIAGVDAHPGKHAERQCPHLKETDDFFFHIKHRNFDKTKLRQVAEYVDTRITDSYTHINGRLSL